MNDSLTRRSLLKLSAAGVMAMPASGWFHSMAAHAAEEEKKGAKHKNCILLYMNGGASHVDTFDPKAGQTEFNAIPTAVPGIQISEHLPRLAKQMKDLALIRSMSTSEGSHARARYMMHTGYREAGGVTHPTLGSIASAVNGDPESDVPNFVSISTAGRGGGKGFLGSGYLGPVHSPLKVTDPATGISNLKHSSPLETLDRQFSVLDEMEKGFLDRKHSTEAESHRESYRSAMRLMHSSKVKAFDLNLEPESVRNSYGAGKFGEGCLLARRLVEIGLPFVEVDMGSWDTHKDNFDRVKTLSEHLDQGMSALINDLKTRGLLENTLVVWMGDFGRTPEVKNGGRGHYPKAWTSVLAGGGLKTGQVIGKTSKTGGTVEDRPVGAKDFLATICKALNVDCNKEFSTRGGRPMRLIDKGEKPITELLS